MASQIRVVFGQTACKLRARRRLTQEELMGMLGMDRSYVNRIESGRARPSLEIIVGLQLALEAPDGELMEGQPKNLSDWRRMNGRKNDM